jgi:hypothetical protein
MSNHPPTLAFDLERDLRVLAAMAANLTPYLYEDEMYGYLGGDLPRLTLGGLLMRLYRLSHLEDSLTAEQRATVADAQTRFEADRSKWAVHYETKLVNELRSRAEALLRFLDECNDDLANCAASYPSQAEKRTMIEHLKDAAEGLNLLTEDHRALLNVVDQKIRRMLRDGNFITDERLKDVYPRDKFWWLYGSVGGNA